MLINQRNTNGGVVNNGRGSSTISTPPASTPPATGGTGGTGGYSGGGTSTGNPSYADYLNGLMGDYQARMRAAVDAANAALDEQANVARRDNANAVARAKQGYEDTRRDSEVNKYKERISMREALANRGLMDSGMGRSLMQKGQIAASNRLNKINISEQNDLADLANNLANIIAQINAQKAQNEMTMQSGMMQNLASMLPYLAQGWNPDTSDYYSAAQQAAGASYTPEYAVQDGNYSGVEGNAAAIEELRRAMNTYPAARGNFNALNAFIPTVNAAAGRNYYNPSTDFVARPWRFNR